jgi:hypothetical protein
MLENINEEGSEIGYMLWQEWVYFALSLHCGKGTDTF